MALSFASLQTVLGTLPTSADFVLEPSPVGAQLLCAYPKETLPQAVAFEEQGIHQTGLSLNEFRFLQGGTSDGLDLPPQDSLPVTAGQYRSFYFRGAGITAAFSA